MIVILSFEEVEKLPNKYKEKLVILQSIGIIVIKVRKQVRYSSEHLIPVIHPDMTEL